MRSATRAIAVVDAPVGPFVIIGVDDAVTEVILPDPTIGVLRPSGHAAAVERAATQLVEYVDGVRRRFDVPMRSEGTAFQEAVWAGLDAIGYGSTESYGWLADHLGRPGSARAVGQALGRNPIPVLRPCHRVVASDGIGGYGGGLRTKRWLLALEADGPARARSGTLEI